MHKYTADFIFTGNEVLQDHVVICNEDGVILDIEKKSKIDSSSIQHFNGGIIPGLINCHCHLELSHLKAKVNTGTGLPHFLINVVQQRAAEEEVILKRISEEDDYMWSVGIQAVGDISNTEHTIKTKIESPIRYHSFIEMFDLFISAQTEGSFNNYAEVYKKYLGHNLSASACPHAPYSVSDQLYDKINTLNQAHQKPVSIHNQETPSENTFTLRGEGELLKLYETLNINLEFVPSGTRSINHAIDRMSATHPTLLVHNTMSDIVDLETTLNRKGQYYWVTCPRANLYIENRLPQLNQWWNEGVNICIGTDSLTSNWSLSIWQEMRTIHKYQSDIPTSELLKWATMNGAEALGLTESLGHIAKGKKPGLLQVPVDSEGNIDLKTDTEPNRII